jgi:K+-transporting ATPase KdpF subunit
MSIESLAAAAIALGVLIYLIYTLLRPGRF